MAVLFDQQKDLTKVEFYDYGSDTVNQLNVSDFDLFDNGAEVGDIMCFGWGTSGSGRPWHDLYLTISTPLQINATLDWYVLQGDFVWVALTITNDGTNGFTQSGWIEFDCPPQMNQGYAQPGYLTFAIKCEITAFTSITQVGHVDSRPQIKDFTIEVTGTETMTSIKAANDSGTWGVVDQEGSRFKIWSNFYLNGSVLSLNELIEVGDEDVGRYMPAATDSVLTLGEIDGNGYTQNGSVFRYTNNSSAYPVTYFRGTLTMYSSEFFHNSSAERDFLVVSTSVFYLKNSVLRSRSGRYLLNTGDCTVLNSQLIITAGSQRIFVSSENVVFDNVNFVMSGVWAQRDNSFTIQNSDLSEDYLHIYPYSFSAGVASSVATMIDCDLGDKSGWDGKIAPYTAGIGIIKYNLNLTMHDRDGNDISNPLLTITNANGDEVYNGVYSGGDILLEVFKEELVNSQKTLYDYNPFTIKIEKSGYQYYQDIMDVESRLEHSISLQPSVEYI
jgi:hypothetical protein